MRLLVGLGNPGAEYNHTRHNAGFVCVDAVAEKLGVTSWKEFKGGLLATTTLGKEKVLLFKPMQYINNSGVQVREVAAYYSIETIDMCVVSDDVYIHPGTARIRQSGGDGGHNGLKSLMASLDPDVFWRVKIGVGPYEQKPEDRHHLPPLEDFVLQKLPPHEEKSVQKLIDIVVPDLVRWLEHGDNLSQKTLHI